MSFITPKQRARAYIIQALYQWQLCGENIKVIEAEFLAKKQGKISRRFFCETLLGVVEDFDNLTADIQPHLEHNIDEIPLVDLSILYLGVYELKHHHNLSRKIIFNEAIELVKNYGTEEGYRFINHLLDTISNDFEQIKKKELDDSVFKQAT